MVWGQTWKLSMPFHLLPGPMCSDTHHLQGPPTLAGALTICHRGSDHETSTTTSSLGSCPKHPPSPPPCNCRGSPTENVAAFWELLQIYILNSGPGPPGLPPNRPEMTGTGGPGPPKNNPTVEPQITNTKHRPKVSQTRYCTKEQPSRRQNMKPSDNPTRTRGKRRNIDENHGGATAAPPPPAARLSGGKRHKKTGTGPGARSTGGGC